MNRLKKCFGVTGAKIATYPVELIPGFFGFDHRGHDPINKSLLRKMVALLHTCGLRRPVKHEGAAAFGTEKNTTPEQACCRT